MSDEIRAQIVESAKVVDPHAFDRERARALARGRDVPSMLEAVAILEESLKVHPGDARLLAALGVTLILLYGLTGSNDPPLAARGEECVLRALALDPTLGEAYHAIGLLRAEQGEIRTAVRSYREAIARAPDFAEPYIGLGVALGETGNVDEALRRFERALELDPDAVVARVERARLLGLIGDRAAAERDLAAVEAHWAHAFLVRAVIWWNDRALAARLADAFERAPTGAAWERATPVLRAFARGERLAGVEVLFDHLFAQIQSADRSRCRVVEIAAEYFAAFDERALALQWLERADDLPLVNLTWVDRCPSLASIRSDPRFTRVRALVAARAADVWR